MPPAKGLTFGGPVSRVGLAGRPRANETHQAGGLQNAS